MNCPLIHVQGQRCRFCGEGDRTMHAGSPTDAALHRQALSSAEERFRAEARRLGLRLRVESRHRHCDSCRCPEIDREREARNSPPMEWRYEHDPAKPLPVVLL